MKTIALIALAVALGLAWSGVALPADDAREKARDVKQDSRTERSGASGTLPTAASAATDSQHEKRVQKP